MDSWILTSPSEKTSKQTVAPFPSTCLAQLRRQDSLPETSVRTAVLLPWTTWYDLDCPGLPRASLTALLCPELPRYEKNQKPTVTLSSK